MKEVMGIN